MSCLGEVSYPGVIYGMTAVNLSPTLSGGTEGGPETPDMAVRVGPLLRAGGVFVVVVREANARDGGRR